MTVVKHAAIAALATLVLAACQTVNYMGLIASNNVAGWFSGGKSVSVNLTGAEEVPPVSSSASGKGSFTIEDDGSVKGSITTSGLSGTMAHIHRGAKGQNGPVAIGLRKDGDTYTVPEG